MKRPPWTYPGPTDQAETDDEATLDDELQHLLGWRSAGWSVEQCGIWLVGGPVARRRPPQGWKLHLSARIHSVRTVLGRVMPILIAVECHVKLARSLRQLQILNGVAYRKGARGSF